MADKSLEEAARSYLIEMFDIGAEDVHPNAHFSKDLDLDSIDLVDWISRINDEFNLDLSPYDFEQCAQLKDFLTVLEKHADKQTGDDNGNDRT